MVGSLLAINIVIAFYTTQVHQSGVVAVLDYLRTRQEAEMGAPRVQSKDLTVGFLMPCHSTPWRSHLVHSSIDAWALKCEPPVNMEPDEKSLYVDEADRFYADPIEFARSEISNLTISSKRRRKSTGPLSSDDTWPDCIVFFEQLERTMADIVKLRQNGVGNTLTDDGDEAVYRECWRGFNSHWHDDWRREGDVIAWCTSCA